MIKEPQPIGVFLKPAIKRFEEMEVEAQNLRRKLDKFLEGKVCYCSEHPEIKLPIDHDKSFAKSWFDRKAGKLHAKFAKCPECEAEEKARFVNKRWMKIGVPQNLCHATIENFKTGDDERKIRALEKVKKKIKSKKGFLILRGTYGTAKTHLAVGVLKTFGGILVTEANLVGELRQSYSDNTGPDDLVNKYCKAECLVLDELDKTIKGTDIPGLLYRILGHRYDNEMLTVITSNDTLDEIKAILGGKLVDRMKEDYEIAHFEWESYRHAN